MKYLVTSVLENVICLIPYAIFCFYPFMDKIKITKGRFIGLLCILFAIEISFFVFISILFSESSLPNIIFMLAMLVNLIVFMKTVNVSNMKLLFVFIVILQLASVIRGIRFYIGAIQFGIFNPFTYYIDPQVSLLLTTIEFFIMMAVMFPICRILRFKFVPLMDTITNIQWRTLLVIPLMLLLIVFSITTLSTDMINSISYIGELLATLAGSFAIYIVIFSLLKRSAENAKLREDNMVYEYREQYYSLLSSHIEETKKARHDLRHHIRLISEFLNNKEYEAMEKYLAEYGATVHIDSDLFFCEHNVANIMLNYYAGIAQNAGMTMEISANIPQELGILDADMSALLGNCIENAIEGCTRQKLDEKKICIHIAADENKIVLAIDNTTGDVLREKSGGILSTKTAGKGIGLKSISSIAEKYEGFAWFEEENHVFKTSVILYSKN